MANPIKMDSSKEINKSKSLPKDTDMLRMECKEGRNQRVLRIPCAASNIPSTWA